MVMNVAKQMGKIMVAVKEEVMEGVVEGVVMEAEEEMKEAVSPIILRVKHRKSTILLLTRQTARLLHFFLERQPMN
jgi:hypothetical protein